MNPNETRALARLPHLDIELHHRAADDTGAETLRVTLRGKPDLAAAMALFDPFRVLTTWSAFNPWLAPWAALAGRERARRLGHGAGRVSPPRA